MVYINWRALIGMAKTGVAKLFRNGRSQAVRLPKEFRFEGDRVRIRQLPGGGVILEPMIADPAKWLANLKEFDADPLFPKGRKQRKPMVRRMFD
jgi:antitoxin VapB